MDYRPVSTRTRSKTEKAILEKYRAMKRESGVSPSPNSKRLKWSNKNVGESSSVGLKRERSLGVDVVEVIEVVDSDDDEVVVSEGKEGGAADVDEDVGPDGKVTDDGGDLHSCSAHDTDVRSEQVPDFVGLKRERSLGVDVVEVIEVVDSDDDEVVVSEGKEGGAADVDEDVGPDGKVTDDGGDLHSCSAHDTDVRSEQVPDFVSLPTSTTGQDGNAQALEKQNTCLPVDNPASQSVAIIASDQSDHEDSVVQLSKTLSSNCAMEVNQSIEFQDRGVLLATSNTVEDGDAQITGNQITCQPVENPVSQVVGIVESDHEASTAVVQLQPPSETAAIGIEIQPSREDHTSPQVSQAPMQHLENYSQAPILRPQTSSAPSPSLQTTLSASAIAPSQHYTAPIMQTVPLSPASSSIPGRPPHIGTFSCSTGIPQGGGQIRTPAPHLQSFRPSTSFTGTSPLSSQQGGISNPHSFT